MWTRKLAMKQKIELNRGMNGKKLTTEQIIDQNILRIDDRINTKRILAQNRMQNITGLECRMGQKRLQKGMQKRIQKGTKYRNRKDQNVEWNRVDHKMKYHRMEVVEQNIEQNQVKQRLQNVISQIPE